MEPTSIDDILHPCSRDEFLAAYFAKGFLHVPGHSTKFTELLTWSALNRILEERDSARDIQLWKNGKEIDRGSFTRAARVSASELTQLVRGGATLVVNRLDQFHWPVATLAQRLGRALRCVVSTSLYAAWRANHGFGVHWDNHDVLILQVSGRKKWQIYGEAPAKYPLRSGSATVGVPIWEEFMNQGDLLYVPRGWSHFAQPCDEPTVHLTVGLHSYKGIDFFTSISKILEERECMRMDIPLDPGAQAQYLSQVRETIVDVVQDTAFANRFIRDISATVAPRIWFGFPWSVTMDALPTSDLYGIEVATPLKFQIRQRDKDSELDVEFDNKILTFDDATAVLFSYLDEAEGITLNDFYKRWEGTFDRIDLAEFLSNLAKAGMIVFHEPQQSRI